MRRALVCGMSGLLLLAACGSQPAAAPAHHVYVVVQHLHGSWLERRVDFSGSEIQGMAAMERSGFQFKTSPLDGRTVACQVDNDPATFVTCIPQDKPYWALYIASGGKWSSAAGISDVKLRDREAIGWHYAWASEQSPPPMPREI